MHWFTRAALPGTTYATSWDAVGGVTTAAKKDTRAMGNDRLHAATEGKEAGGGTALDAEAVRRRHGMKAELLLALPPTLVVLATVFGIELLRHQRVLYASLASSAFLVYRDPAHRMNTVRVMVTAHVVAVLMGMGAALLLHPGYTAAAVAMIGTIIALVMLDAVHPPAVSTTLGFAFVAGQDEAIGLFLLALVMLAALVLIQRASVWALKAVG